MKIATKRLSDEMHVTIRGSIDENAEVILQELLRTVDVSKITFNLEQVEQVNSVGTFYWYQLCQNLAKKAVTLKLEKCSIGFIECCNIYRNLAPAHTITSLYVPTQCDACEEEKPLLCEASQLKRDKGIPQSRCDACQDPLSVQVDLVEYLQFLLE